MHQHPTHSIDHADSGDRVTHTYTCDVLVIGSGVSGYCAAIQAGQRGCDVILLEKDEVLGGNSGPNLGVGITGADRYNPYGTETGLIHRLQEEAAWCGGFTAVSAGTVPYNIHRRNEATIATYLAEAGVTVLKRHYARHPITESGRILAVIAEDLAAFRTVRIEVRHIVVEASGDGHIGALAGADWDMGNESAAEYGERSAPPERCTRMQGTSLVAIAHRTDHEVEFVPPPNTPPYEPRVWQSTLSSFIHHVHDGVFDRPGDSLFGEEEKIKFLYLTETGGHMDTIADDGRIYDMLLSQLWAEWDHIKNGPHHEEARNWDLLWVSPKAGKRESRRFIGDVILTQTDLEAGRRFEDDIAYGGHDLDEHQPFGSAANIVGCSIPPMYGIPYRACYSRNVENLFLAGRLISATHLAHSSSRLMRTGGAIGQAVGLAAAICCEKHCTPREVYQKHLGHLQESLLTEDGSILCRPLRLTGDLALEATVAASSEIHYNDQTPDQMIPLIGPAGMVLWDWPARLEHLSLYLDNRDRAAQPLRVTLLRAHREPRWLAFGPYHQHRRDDLRSSAFREVAAIDAIVPSGHQGWFDIAWEKPIELGAKDAASDDDRVIVRLDAGPALRWAAAARPCEIAGMVEYLAIEDRWQRMGVMGTLRLTPSPQLGDAANAINGHHRRYSHGPTNMWISDPSDGLPQELVLSWDAPQTFDQATLVFDDLAPSRELYPWESARRVMPQLVAAYAVDAWIDGAWRTLFQVDDNHLRHRRHRFEAVTSKRLRLRVLATHGDGQSARVYTMRVEHMA